MSINPTVGRVVLVFFAPASSAAMEGYGLPTTSDTPVPGLIARVHDDGLINVAAFDVYGANLPLTNVRLLQDGDERPTGGCWAEWMPYQKQQAEKHAIEQTSTTATKTGNVDASEAEIEREIQAKGLTAPRLSPSDLDANIVHTEIVKHVSLTGQVLRWAVMTTKNGFAVVGKPSVAVSPANDDAAIGEKVAVDNSRAELWPLMGYALKQALWEKDVSI